MLNLDKRKVDSNHSGHTIHVTLLKIPYQYKVYEIDGTEHLHVGTSVMLVGYVNTTPVFPNLLGQYYALRELIEFEP